MEIITKDISYLFDDEQERVALQKLIDDWRVITRELWESRFDMNNFKRLVRETVETMDKYDTCSIPKMYPEGIVSLLMAMKEFSCSCIISKETEVAMNIAWSLCDIDNLNNLGVDPKNESRFGVIYVDSETTHHKIFIDDLDFTELMADTYEPIRCRLPASDWTIGGIYKD